MKHVWRTILTSAAAIVVASVSLRATAIVILTSADRVVIAADSRVSHSILTNQDADNSGCKIWVRGNIAATMSGAVAAADGRWDAREQIPKALAEPGTLQDKYIAALRLLQSQLTVQDPFHVVEVNLAFVSYDQNRGPDVAVGKARLPASRVSAPGVCKGQGVCIVAALLGDEAADDPVAPLERELRERQPSEARMIEMARGVIREQAAHFPTKVGGPTDVLVIDSQGARWIVRKHLCNG